MISRTNTLKITVVTLSIMLNAVLGFAKRDSTNHERTIARLSKNQTFVNYFNRFKLLVKNNDKQALAKFLDNSYNTLTVGLGEKGSRPYESKKISIRNRADFLKYYPQLFDERMRRTISKQEIKDLHVDAYGICLYRGQVWFQNLVDKKMVIVSSITNNSYFFPYIHFSLYLCLLVRILCDKCTC